LPACSLQNAALASHRCSKQPIFDCAMEKKNSHKAKCTHSLPHFHALCFLHCSGPVSHLPCVSHSSDCYNGGDISNFICRRVLVILFEELKILVVLSVGRIYYIILYPYLLSFGSFSNIIFTTFTCCICFCSFGPLAIGWAPSHVLSQLGFIFLFMLLFGAFLGNFLDFWGLLCLVLLSLA